MEFIYHYTSIETLALILKSRCIRFNNLLNVDDVVESQFSDEDINLSSYTLISCWTSSNEENLAFWNMYTPNMRGVRIKISKNLFDTYQFDTENIFDIKEDSIIENSLVPKSECFNENYWIIPFKENFFEVIYTDDVTLLHPRIYNISDNKFIVKIGNIGRYKSKVWEFQKEIRYKLFVLPTRDISGKKINPLGNLQKIMFEKIPSPLGSYLLKIRDEAFENMEVTLGPKCNEAEEIIVSSLLGRFNKTAKMHINTLKGLIK